MKFFGSRRFASIAAFVSSVLAVGSVFVTGVSGVAPIVDDPPIQRAKTESAYIVELAPRIPERGFNPDSPNATRLAVAAAAESVIETVSRSGGEVTHEYSTGPFISVVTDDPAALLDQPGVVAVRPEQIAHKSLAASLGVVNATDSDLDGALNGQSADGSGYAIAIIDDGIDRTHPMFMNGATSRVILEACFTNGECNYGIGDADSRVGVGAAAHQSYVVDGVVYYDWHGTHVAGIAAGNSRGSSTAVPRGVAKESAIVAVQVFDSDGFTSGSKVDAALEWVLSKKNTGTPIAAVNMSLGGSARFPAGCDNAAPSTKSVIDALNAAGVVVVVASGNVGWTNGMSWPACLTNVVPVGASTNTDGIAGFSNIGVNTAVKGVLAPGVRICSAVNRQELPSGYGCASGTSMAAPHVAGAAVLMRQAKPSASMAEIVAALRESSALIGDTRTGGSVTGIPRLDVKAGIVSLLPTTGSVLGSVVDATDDPPVALANTELELSFEPQGEANENTSFTSTVVTSATGAFTVTGVRPGAWRISVASTGYTTVTSETIEVVAGAEVSVNQSLVAPTGSVSGSVSQGSGAFTEVTLRFVPKAGNPWTENSRVVTALPETGQFSVSGVRSGQWSVEFSSDDAVSESIDVTVAANQESVLGSIELVAPVGTLSGTITRALNNSAIATSPVTISGSPVGAPSGRVAFSTTVSTNAQGSYTLPVLRVGSWSITVAAQGFESETSSVVVSANSTTTLDVALDYLLGGFGGTMIDPAATSSGVSRLSNLVEGLATLTVTPQGDTTGRSTFSQTVNLASSGGAYTVLGVTPGEWSVTSSVFGFGPTAPRSVTVLPDQTAVGVDFTLSRRTAMVSVSPSSGPTSGGTQVTITGLHLSGATQVSFGGTAGTNVVVSPDGRSLTVLTPAKTAGSVPVTVTTGLGTSTDVVSFTFVAPEPSPGGGGGGGGGGFIGGGGGGGSSSASGTLTSVGPNLVRAVVGLAFGDVVVDIASPLGGGEVRVEEKTGTPPGSTTGAVLPSGWLDISSTVGVFQSAEVCVPVEVAKMVAAGLTFSDARLFHWVNGARVDVTTRLDNASVRVCGVVTSFSPFAVGGLKTKRTFGADRYETAAALSAQVFGSGVGVVYVVTGEKFPDALAAGAIAGRDRGPVLLTRLNSLPDATRAEIVRLQPSRIVVVGGTAVISSSVITALRSAVPGALVERVAGADRYETSVELSKRTYSTTGGTVYLGSGLGFTEVLAGSVLAGRDGAPLLLVPGSSSTLPWSVAFELSRLKPSRVVVFGDSNLVSSAITAQIQKLFPATSLERVSGADAYAVAANISSRVPAGGGVYVATGAVFADGLAGSAAAVAAGWPVVVVPPTGVVPTAILDVLAAMRPQRVTLLGGPAAVAYDVENQLADYVQQ